MTQYFDSLVHANADGGWLGANRYDASPDRLISELDRVGTWRACLVGIAGYCDDNFTLELARAHPDRFVPVAGVDPMTLTAEPAETAAALGRRGFKGVKLHSRLNGYDPMDNRVTEMIMACSHAGLVVFLDTLFRQPARVTSHPVNIVDHFATALATLKDPAPLVLLHATGATMLELFELGRAHPHLLIDLSFTIMRYAGSSVDADIGFMCRELDQRVILGSDMPEYTPTEVLARFEALTPALSEEKRNNVLFRNLERVFP